MDKDPERKPDGTSAEIFEDILSEPKIAQVSFTDQKLGEFDAASAAHLAAAKPEQPKKRFGKRSDRKKKENNQPAPAFAAAEPVKEEAVPSKSPAPSALAGASKPAPAASKSASASAAKPAGTSSSAPKASTGFVAAQIRQQEKQAALEQTEPYEKATFVKPVAANVVLNSSASPKKPTEEEEETTREQELFAGFEEPVLNLEEEEEEEVIDPSSSLVDDYDYSLYEDRKGFLLTEYPRIEEYLSRQSKQGYHYVRNEGKRYYFHHGFPRNYYYQILYFNEEPPQAQWDLWEEKGWRMLHCNPSKKKSEAGWFVMRNEQEPGTFRQEIENEEEKYRFFRSYSNSCRSTMFLLFICMAVCLVMGLLQYFFRGPIYGIIFAFVLFCIALWCFLLYGRMLRKSAKQVRLLKAKLRLANSEHAISDEDEENDSELDEDWDHLNKKSGKAS